MATPMQDNTRNLPEPTENEYATLQSYSRDCYEDYLPEFMESYRTISETKTRRVFVDGSGYGINEIADQLGIDRERVLHWMYEHCDGVDYDWSNSDPIVLIKP